MAGYRSNDMRLISAKPAQRYPWIGINDAAVQLINNRKYSLLILGLGKKQFDYESNC